MASNHKIAVYAVIAATFAVLIGSGFLQSSYAANVHTKVRTFQNGVQVEDGSPGTIGTDTECVGGLDASAGATKMVCYLIPPNVSNNDNSNAIAQLDTTTNIACPAGAGFSGSPECFSVTFPGSLFTEQGDYHFHVEFYNAQNQLIADGKQTFQNNSFFVLPESPLGILALVGSSIAALGAFVYLRSYKQAAPSPL